ncbi:hypothetical protein [Streptomyces sp. NBC_01236]|uniref:hypothetical protein n=1 Tax=Streptomyces sp. NBC_01236 TaxID=2903789 RepID=UPI002E10FC37|nr:hypothetical protein OG324_50825 [Streptomyces sp. NBC_01236]
MQLTARALASHTSGDAGTTDMEVLARLCGHSPRQTAELLDRLTASHTLTARHHHRETDEVVWYPPQQHGSVSIDRTDCGPHMTCG